MHVKLSVIVGDITQLGMDAIVNAANEWMLGGGGVDGAIHAAAGPELLNACRRVPEVRPGIRCPIGEARITPAFRLPSKYIIHTVGPRWHGGSRGEAQQLANCYRSCFKIALEHGVSTIAFPAISTGAFAYPLRDAACIAVRECIDLIATTPSISVVLVGYNAADAAVIRRVVAQSC